MEVADSIGLPDELETFLHSNFGTIVSKKSLSGVAGDGGATRLKFESKRSVIIKSSLSPRERNFYEQHAGVLRNTGVGIASVYWSGMDANCRHWIVMEDVSDPFPQDRWSCDPKQIQMLFYLHSATWGNKRLKLNDATYHPVWDDELTNQACEWFGNKAERSEVTCRLTEVQQQAQLLFEPICCLSGDPNPTNWRVRDNGELVLIDWERFCHGHPAIDLAITMPNLGSKDGEMESRIADLYIAAWEKHTGCIPVEMNNMDFFIRLGKLWSVVEFLANAKLRPEQYPEATISFIVREIPGFLYELAP